MIAVTSIDRTGTRESANVVAVGSQHCDLTRQIVDGHSIGRQARVIDITGVLTPFVEPLPHSHVRIRRQQARIDVTGQRHDIVGAIDVGNVLSPTDLRNIAHQLQFNIGVIDVVAAIKQQRPVGCVASRIGDHGSLARFESNLAAKSRRVVDGDNTPSSDQRERFSHVGHDDVFEDEPLGPRKRIAVAVIAYAVLAARDQDVGVHLAAPGREAVFLVHRVIDDIVTAEHLTGNGCVPDLDVVVTLNEDTMSESKHVQVQSVDLGIRSPSVQ
ncbi:hypothetical protein Poly51_63660 [Rubripirellula tenax]|uniref:Uncharacterized protein n=1 Tax=Rubripirellula tenax TaxID=2528015 RepID=A0A5C6DWD2_9BACT|nr:hypothetical protein Poly51_63660 [Rubripirellula tenax]